MPTPLTTSKEDPSRQVMERAAVLFAAGRTEEACDALMKHLLALSGNTAARVWYMLFDAYLVQGQKKHFEQLALLFAQQFKTSPPAWEGRQQGHVTLQAGNAIALEGSAMGLETRVITDFVRAARDAGSARINLSRTVLDEPPRHFLIGCEALLLLLRKLRQHKIPSLLMGEEHLVDDLSRAILSTHMEERLAWELLMEFLQWRGHEERFEELAMEYAKRFEVSPPGFEEDGAVALSPGTSPSKEASQPSEMMLPAMVDKNVVDRLQKSIEELAAAEGEARIDASLVRRLTMDAAVELGHLASGLAPSRITLLRPTELVLVLLEVASVAPLVHVLPRKR